MTDWFKFEEVMAPLDTFVLMKLSIVIYYDELDVCLGALHEWDTPGMSVEWVIIDSSLQETNIKLSSVEAWSYFEYLGCRLLCFKTMDDTGHYSFGQKWEKIKGEIKV